MPDGLDPLLFPGGRKSWESPELTSLNRLPPRATLVPFRSPERAATLDRRKSPWFAPLDGEWEFRLADRPEQASRALRAARGWTSAAVPGLWTMQGHGTPH
jgi:beta-galactosidase